MLFLKKNYFILCKKYYLTDNFYNTNVFYNYGHTRLEIGPIQLWYDLNSNHKKVDISHVEFIDMRKFVSMKLAFALHTLLKKPLTCAQFPSQILQLLLFYKQI